MDGVIGFFADLAPNLQLLVDRSPQILDGVKQYGAGGTVFRKEDTSLLDAYNEKLAEIVADEERYLSIVGDFGFTAEELPPKDMTAEILCSGDLSSLQ